MTRRPGRNRGGRTTSRPGGARRGFAVAIAWGAACLVWTPAASAGEADVLAVAAECTTIRTCDFRVTVRHADVGWTHYAVAFEILSPEGEVLGTRELRHPHVHEQPFTRELVGVEIPEGVEAVTVRARDSQHGLGGETVTKPLVFPARDAKPAPTPVQSPDSH